MPCLASCLDPCSAEGGSDGSTTAEPESSDFQETLVEMFDTISGDAVEATPQEEGEEELEETEFKK